MKKYIICLFVIVLSFVLFACESDANSDANDEGAETTTEATSDASQDGVVLFEASGMESIQLTGQQILDGEEANMSVKISDEMTVDFHMSRDNPNGTKLYATCDSETTNLAWNYIAPDVWDNDEAIPSYIYQMSCYDFDEDGVKELVISCGNNADALSIFVFEVVYDAGAAFVPVNYILGYDTASINEANEICVASPQGVRTYKFNVQAQDPEYAKKSGPVKMTLDYASEELLANYAEVNTFAIDEEGTALLLAPTENLTNFSIHRIEYDEATNMFKPTEILYELPEVSPDAPVVIKFYIPDFPSIGFSYSDENGVTQTFGITESLKDGSLYFFQLDIEAKG